LQQQAPSSRIPVRNEGVISLSLYKEEYMMSKSKEDNGDLNLFQLDWKTILPRFGVDPSYLAYTKNTGPCPIEREGKTRFRFDNKDGKGTWFCSQCGGGDGVRLIAKVNGWTDQQALWELRREVKGIEREQGRPPLLPPRDQVREQKEDERKRASARNSLLAVEAEVKPIRENNAVGRYLMRRVVGLKLKWLSNQLGYVERLYHQDLAERDAFGKARVSHRPAMVARVTDRTGKPVTFHRTYLSPDGFKAKVSVNQVKKLMPGVRQLDGDFILVNRPTADPMWRIVLVAEGIETALALVVLTENRYPVLSCMAANNLAKFTPPKGCQMVYIFADRDPVNPKTGYRPGEHYAERLQARLTAMNITSTIKVPKTEGEDFLDILNKRAASSGSLQMRSMPKQTF